MSEALDELYEAIEKAKPLLPKRGGAKKLRPFNDPAVWKRAEQRHAARLAERAALDERYRPKTVADGRRAWASLVAADVRNRK